MESYDIIVLGLGAMGSATARVLAKRGVRTCAIEQFGLAHEMGSSHGKLRVIRKAYFEHPDYVPLLEAAYRAWHELEAECGERLLVETGVLMCGGPGSPTLAGLEACYARSGLPHERLDAQALRQRFPMFMLPEDFAGFLDPSGGYLLVEACIREAVLSAQRAGAEIFLHERVERWEANAAGVSVYTDKRVIHGGALVIAGGPWSATLLEALRLPLRVLRKVQLWYNAAFLDEYLESPFPTWFFETPYGAWYGFPPYGDSGIKLAEHDGGTEIESPELIDRGLNQEDEAAARRFLRDVFFHSAPKLEHFSVCMYTSTPDGNFILDRHPEHPNVCFAAGFSGHGFKFASVVGEVMADLVIDGATCFPVEFLKLERFQA